MKSKSYILKDWLKLANAGGLKYGQLIFECYYKNGKESTPNTSEFLQQNFNSLAEFLTLDDQTHCFFLGLYNTGLFLEEFNDAAGVNVQRITFKPDLLTCSESLMQREINRFKQLAIEKNLKRQQKALNSLQH